MAEPNWNALYSNQGLRLTGNPALTDLRNDIATQRKQKALDNKTYADQIAKLNFGGAKDADLGLLHKQYGDIINRFGELRNTNDPTKRAVLQQQLAQDQNKFLFDIERSKNANKQDLEGSHAILSAPDEKLKEGARDRWLKAHSTSTFDPTYEGVYEDAAKNTWADKPVDVVGETEKFVKSSMHNLVKDDVQENLKGGAFRINGEKGVVLNKEKLINDITKRADLDKGYMAGIVKATGITDPQQALKTFIDATVSDANQATYMAKDIGSMQNRPFKPSSGGSGDGGAGTVGTPEDLIVNYKGGKEAFTSKNGINFTSPTVNLAGSASYNVSTGELEPQVLPSGDYQIYRVSSVPFITGNAVSGGKQLKGTIAQDKFVREHPNDVEYRQMMHVQYKDPDTGENEDKLVPYDRLPKNMPKATMKVLSGFKPYTLSVPKQVAQPQAKMPFSSSTHVTVQLPDGTTGQISRSKLKDFQLKYPKAKILQ